MDKLLGKLLWKISRVFNYLQLVFTKLVLKFETPTEVLETVEELRDLYPHSFSTFKEGMASTNYYTRHDAATKLVGWYLYSDGHPLIEELVRAADVLLEDTPATLGDISFLVGAWKDQASATTDADREAAEQREHKIYEDLATKVANPIK